MPRLFVALRPPAPVRDALIDTMEGIEGARWQDEDQLHLTLRFAGEVPERQAQDLAGALAAIRAEGFELQVSGTGHFEKKRAAHTLWAGLAPAAPLLHLQRKVERACQMAGLAPETRRFAPHVTVARLNRSSGAVAPWLARHALLRTPPWQARSFALYRSDLTDAGALYTPLETYPLLPPTEARAPSPG